MEAAHTVFLRRGTAGARMQEIAAEAGVNQAMLHYYFRSKQQLAAAVFHSVAMRLLPPVIAVLASDADIEEKVHRVVEIELEQLSQSPYVPAYLISEMSHHQERTADFIKTMTGLEIAGAVLSARDTLARQIEERVRAGTMRPISVEQFVVNLISLCVFPFAARPLLSAALRLDAPQFRRFIEERRTELPTFFLNALRP